MKTSLLRSVLVGCSWLFLAVAAAPYVLGGPGIVRAVIDLVRAPTGDALETVIAAISFAVLLRPLIRFLIKGYQPFKTTWTAFVLFFGIGGFHLLFGQHSTEPYMGTSVSGVPLIPLVAWGFRFAVYKLSGSPQVRDDEPEPDPI